jgi:hypothetical protein
MLIHCFSAPPPRKLTAIWREDYESYMYSPCHEETLHVGNSTHSACAL